MKLALELASKGKGATSPNPMVGAVLVRNGKIVGKGYHRKAGSLHAEVVAIKDSRGKAKGATLFVNLEPCVHYGKTPPCCDEIIRARISKVVIGMKDPNPLVNGKGIRKLKIHGIEVEVGVMEKEAEEIKTLVNSGGKKPWLKLWDDELGYYMAYAWKDHDGIREEGPWFDSLGNILAIVFGLADKDKSKKILWYIEKKRINKPFPVKCLDPPFYRNTKDWQPYFDKCISEPHWYLNGGIWPYIGGFYVAALVKVKYYKKAEKELENLAKANMSKGIKWRFSEWLDAKKGNPRGSEYQSWSIGMYLYAYQCVKKKKVLLVK